MPPRKKQKTATAASTASNPSPDFPSASLLTLALTHHPYALSLRSKEHTKTPDALTDLDAWLTTTLSAKIASAQPITKPDMTSLMKWKLARGKSRPTLLGLVASNAEALVMRSTSAALQTVRAATDIDGALLALPDACALRGVGAATASALLTLHPPHLLPFMSDEAAAFFVSSLGGIKYTDAFYAKFARAMRGTVVRLNADLAADAQIWDCMKLERALFALNILRKHGEEGILDADPGSSTSPSGSLKRRRDGGDE
ncbi:hypothetical protein B0H17DRAFT_1332788 [Mycena rosella]|uniref:Uncharacterized protein n=1 Tax=Mycena rosella TaxID=1033263 RepID=A0AAD7DA06_MYCRO|nr:hypothetical protein B0H17DRAFT_1332788 [Mycena rosella]